MSRTTMGVVAGLLVMGCVVAMLPAQESSRRTAKKPGTGQTALERPNLSPFPQVTDGDLPPVVSAPGRSMPPISGTGRAASIDQKSAFVPPGQAPESPASEGTASLSDLGQLPPTQLPPGPSIIGVETRKAAEPKVTTDAVVTDLDDSRLHSVLKRTPAPAADEPAAVQPFLQAPAISANNAPGTGELPRRPASSIGAMPAPLPGTSRLSPSAQPATSRGNQGFAASSKSAALKVEISGPQGVTVGKPALYVVNVSNESDTPADDLQLRIALPGFVAVNSAQPTNGEAGLQGDGQGGGRMLWSLPRIAGRGREQLKLQLVTGEGDNFDLGVEWTCKPAIARAAIVVKQPQLALTLAGPADMVFGDEKTFTLTVSNPGNGDAERVTVSVSAANSPPQQFDAGTIPAGHKKEVPLAVVASQAGTIDLAITAAGEGGLEARTAGKVMVRKAEVNVAIEGPPLKYAGSEAVYLVAVNNSGTAAAENINLSLALPNGAKYLGGIESASASATSVKWKVASLAPGGERQYEVRLQLSSAGSNRVVVQSQAAASGTATSAAETEVEAISDLKLVVNDPAGPMPTGEQAVYELQVLNRGSQAARQVKIVMQFSEGVEPVSFEGCEARIMPGQVVCQPLTQLGPGEQATLRVRAKAEQAGSHHFRVEVTTTDGDARLVSEGTTRFFTDGVRGGAAASTARKPSLVPGPSAPTVVR